MFHSTHIVDISHNRHFPTDGHLDSRQSSRPLCSVEISDPVNRNWIKLMPNAVPSRNSPWSPCLRNPKKINRFEIWHHHFALADFGIPRWYTMRWWQSLTSQYARPMLYVDPLRNIIFPVKTIVLVIKYQSHINLPTMVLSCLYNNETMAAWTSLDSIVEKGWIFLHFHTFWNVPAIVSANVNAFYILYKHISI